MARAPRLRRARPSSPSTKQQREKRRRSGGDSDEDDDEEYRPSHGDHGGDDDDEVEGRDGSCSSSSSSSSYSAGEEEEEEEEEEEVGGSSRGSKRKRKKKNLSNSQKGCKRSCVKGNIEKPDDFVDEDAALEQAIALSLGGVAENSAVSGVLSQKSGTKESETGGKRKNRKLFKSRVQLSEDEVIGYFFLFDEVGKGHISVWDLQRMALAHDFTWTDSETAAMVHLFDTDGDGKLNLEDFRTIASRCNMMHEP
ncbi:caltractin-like [Ananas comosus]|uniref:Caltractin-like n=1 Tax=Ananas comosus TaxID=4615 RepID=A0A6P5FHL3_ANACO|nr:caltractin-like [Ananas comosus]